MKPSRVSNREAKGCIARKREFINHNKTFRGLIIKRSDWYSTGRMPLELSKSFRQDIKLNESTYVVFSYETPIAWVKMYGDEGFVAPEVRYSQTTTRHQGLVALAIAEYDSRATRRHQSILHRGVKEYEEKINA